tara:strand:- start:3270 stop:3728 length:459 start_codon:yes stop_codon:yes gene_type:complete
MIDIRLYCPGSTFKPFITENLREFVRRHSLDGCCHLLGFISDDELEELYGNVDLVVSPSLAEGGAYLFQESLVFNLPFCSSGFEQVKTHVERLSGHCLYFDPYSPESISSAILEAFEKREKLRSDNALARDTVFSWKWDSVANKILSKLINN